LIGRSKGVILPSRSEGFGLVWAEALSCGKPVLATDTGLGTEIPDYCGVRIDTDYTERELESGIEELKDGAYDTDDIRSYAERNFDWGEVMKQYIEIYR
ncbi:MAG: glycosyltransferase, partial [Candidatus Nanohaloarchaea archaeon]